MKQIILCLLFISASFFSFSQKQDTLNLFGPGKKKVRKDVTKDLEAHPLSKLDSVYYIKYGTCEGKCTGSCYHEATIDSTHMIRINKTSAADKNPIKTDSTEISVDQWSMLINSIEISSFFSIPAKIGSPDPINGAAEWIEINYTGKTHKVMFDSTGPDEYEGIKNLEKLLKRITEF